MRHGPQPRASDDDDTEEDASEEDASEEDEYLIGVNPSVFQHQQAWGRREAAAAGGCIAAWYLLSVTVLMANKLILRARSFDYPFLASFTYMALKWLLSRLMLLASGQPPLAFNGWRPYLCTIAAAGVLTSLDVSLSLASYFYVTVTFVVTVKSSAPCWQLLFGTLLGIEQARLELLAVVLVVSVGVGLAARGEFTFSWLPFSLLLGSAALAGLRGCLLQRLLHCNPAAGNEVPGLLLQRRQGVHPLQLMAALAPWSTLASALTTAVFEGTALWRAEQAKLPLASVLIPRLAGVGVIVFCLVLVEMEIIRRTSALTLSIAGTVKEAFAIVVAEQLFHDQLGPLNVVGIVLCLTGTQLYAWTKLRRSAWHEPADHSQRHAHAQGGRAAWQRHAPKHRHKQIGRHAGTT